MLNDAGMIHVKSRRSERPRDRREQILAAALDLFAADGLHVTTRAIARAVGISQPSLYAHFASASDIMVELCCRAFDRLRQRMIDARDGGGEVGDRLARMGHAYIDFGLGEPAAYRVAFMLERPPGEPKPERAHAAGLASYAVMRDYVASLAPAGGADTADATAQRVWAGLHGLVALLLARPDFPWIDRAALVAAQVDMMRREIERSLAMPPSADGAPSNAPRGRCRR
jgi:AcrR family transcriptional regulator